jgi:hypothetical protein
LDNVVSIDGGSNKADDKAVTALISEAMDAANDVLQQIKQSNQ